MTMTDRQTFRYLNNPRAVQNIMEPLLAGTSQYICPDLSLIVEQEVSQIRQRN